MSDTTNAVPTSSKLSELLARHKITPPTFWRLPIKPRIFYVGRSPRVTDEAERAWLKAMQEHAGEQRVANTERARLVVAARRSRPPARQASVEAAAALARALKAGADAWAPPAKPELHDAHVREFERVKGKRTKGAAK